MVAAYYKHADCARLLLERGALLTTAMIHGSSFPMPAGSTALHCAARVNNLTIVCEILKALVRTSLLGDLPSCLLAHVTF
jgi:ankyrin repeat protein